MILAGDLPAGGKLNEAAIAERLGVSRGPVREAFRALEESGLVRLEKNRGVFVRQISVDEADEIYELRAVLDEFVGRRARADGDAPSTSASCARASTAWSAPRPRAMSTPTLAANLDFHDRLVELAGNAKLLATYRRLVNELHLFRRATLAQGGDAAGLDARASRDRRARSPRASAAAAGRALLDHVMASRERMHRTQPGARVAPARRRGRIREEIPLMPAAAHRQRPHATAGRTRPLVVVCVDGCEPDYINQAIAAGPRAVPRRAARDAAPASPPTASCRRSPTRTTCRSSPARRRRCTASAATTSGTATPAPK